MPVYLIRDHKLRLEPAAVHSELRTDVPADLILPTGQAVGLSRFTLTASRPLRPYNIAVEEIWTAAWNVRLQKNELRYRSNMVTNFIQKAGI